jgi:acyl dehydratase
MISLERSFTQADFDAFAALSGDHNPIHIDPDFAARSRFGRTVAHGVMLATVLRGLAEQLRPGCAISVQALRFPAPTFANEPMRFSLRADGLSLMADVVRIADGTVTCDGSFTLVGARRSLQRAFSAADVSAYAALGGHPTTGVPEPLIGALISTLLGMHLPGLGTNYLKQELTFLSAAQIGERLNAEVVLTRLRNDKHLADLATRVSGEDGRLIADGRSLVYVEDVAAGWMD